VARIDEFNPNTKEGGKNMMKFYWTEKEASFEAFRCGDCIIFEDGRMLWRQWFFEEGGDEYAFSQTPYRTGRVDDENCDDWFFHSDFKAPHDCFKSLQEMEATK
jgi:hypothetical protein